MNKPLPWNVKGVGFDAREAARIAAKRAGVPLGEWLNGVISARAAELGVKVDDVEADDRLEAIAARLSADETTGGLAHVDEAAPPRHAIGAAPGLDAMSGTVRELARLQSGRRPALPARGDLRQPLLTRFDRAAQPASGESGFPDAVPVAAAEAASPVAVEPTDTAHAVEAPAEAPTTDAPPAPRSTGKIARKAAQFEAAQLDARLAAILEKLNTSCAEAEAIEAPTGRDAVAGRAVSAAEAVPADSPPAREEATGREPAIRPTRADNRRRDDGFTDLHAAFKDLASKLDGQTPLPQAAEARAAATDLAAEIAVLGRRVDRLRGPAPERAEPGRAPDVQTLRRETAQLSADLSQLAPQQSLASLETAVRELAGRVDLSRLDGVQASVLAPVERLSREMREAIRAADVAPAMKALRRDMAAMAAKVDALQREVDPKTFETLRDDLHEMRDAIGTLTGRLGTAERLQGEVVALGDRVSALAERTGPTVARDLGAAVGDIRDLLRSFSEDGGLGTLDRKVDALSARMDTLVGAREPTAVLDDFARRIDRAHDGLVERLAPLSATASGLSALHDRISALSGKIDTFGRSSQDVHTLYGLVGSLADRLEKARSPQAGSETLNALQAQIGTLVERLDKTTATDATLQGLERLIGDLFLQIEQSRNTAIDAAENAARAAAQDTLRAAMDNPALNGAELTVQTGLDVDHVSQELAELRRVQETSDRRVNATLTALNTTLERLVDRLVAEGAAKTQDVPAPAGQTMGRRRGRGSPEPTVADRGPAADLPAFDPEQFLVEPGSGEGPGRARGGEPFDPAVIGAARTDPADPASDVAPLIAAARRAAQAAQASALEASLKVDAPAEAAGRTGKTRSFFASKRRALLLGLAGVVLLAGTLQVVRLSTDHDGDGASATAEPASDPTAAEPKAAAVPPAPAPKEVLPAAPDQLPAAPAAPPAVSTPGNGASLLAPPANADKVSAGFAAPAAASSAPPAIADAALNGLSQGLKDLAASGSAAAQYEVAARLSDGRGVNRDTKQAVAWFERAAQQGFAPAQYRLGSLYEKGVGVTADPALAVAWYEKAAGQGNVRAMHNLAVMSAEGSGGKPDYGKAVTWFTKAASYGVRDSQFNLAVLFARGLGVPQSFSQSYAWFAVAAQQGDGDAVTKRDAVAGKLDAKALADAKATVASFHPLTPEPAANDVAPPPGGWDAAATAKASGRKSEARLSSM